MKVYTHITMAMTLLACGQRQVEEPDIGPPPDVGTPSSSDPGGGEVVCREGLALCDGACVDLRSSNEHCGACDHACDRPSWFGMCMNGGCPPALSCGRRELRTCDDVCASHGQMCVGDPPDASAWSGCGGGYVLYFSDLDDDPLELCEEAIGSYQGVEATCSTPIDWSQRGGLEYDLAGAVACCCTQDPP